MIAGTASPLVAGFSLLYSISLSRQPSSRHCDNLILIRVLIEGRRQSGAAATVV